MENNTSGLRRFFKRIITAQFILFNLFLATALVSAYFFYLSWINTLYRSNNWTSSKTRMEKGLMGAWSFMLTHRSLTYNHLDPGTWHGYQELFLQKNPEMGSVTFNFKLTDYSYFTVYISRQSDTLSGFRISNDPEYPSAFLKVVDYRFIEKDPFRTAVIPGKWNSCSIRCDSDKVFFKINDTCIKTLPMPVEGKAVLGFRGSGRSTLLDDVRIRNHEGREVFYDDFGLKHSHRLIFSLIFIGLNLLYLLLFKFRKTILMVMIYLAAFTFSFSLFYQFYGQTLYPKKWMIKWQNKVTSIEEIKDVHRRLLDSYFTPDQQDKFKIILLGTSQTWGAGASSENRTFARRFEKELREYCHNQDISVMNAGVSGPNSSYILSFYKKYWIKVKPDFCIINLCNNDGGSPDFKANLEEFVKLNSSRQIETVFIPEPAAIYNDELIENHSIMKNVAEKYGISMVVMGPYLQEHHDDGFLWWDFIHLTDYGQELFTKKLFDEIKNLVSTKVENKTAKDKKRNNH